MTSPTSRLEKWKRNEIFTAIKAAGLDPREFKLVDSLDEVRFYHLWSKSCFFIGGDASHYHGSYVVGDATAWPYDAYSWQNVMQRLSRWLEDAKRDLDMPDLWAGLQREAKLLGVASNETVANTPFTQDEQKVITAQLGELAASVKHDYSLSEAQAEVLDEKIDLLVEAAGRVGRKDWQLMLGGVILTLLASAVIPPEALHYILTTLVQGIGHLFGILKQLHG